MVRSMPSTRAAWLDSGLKDDLPERDASRRGATIGARERRDQYRAAGRTRARGAEVNFAFGRQGRRPLPLENPARTG
jgi:hypothetical protein